MNRFLTSAGIVVLVAALLAACAPVSTKTGSPNALIPPGFSPQVKLKPHATCPAAPQLAWENTPNGYAMFAGYRCVYGIWKEVLAGDVDANGVYIEDLRTGNARYVAAADMSSSFHFDNHYVVPMQNGAKVYSKDGSTLETQVNYDRSTAKWSVYSSDPYTTGGTANWTQPMTPDITLGCLAAVIGTIGTALGLIQAILALPEEGPVAPVGVLAVLSQATLLDAMFAAIAAECQ